MWISQTSDDVRNHKSFFLVINISLVFSNRLLNDAECLKPTLFYNDKSQILFVTYPTLQPIKAALWWFCERSLLKDEGITQELVDRIPGRQTDRKTPLGELNWIFTAITDTIAWNMLPRALFQRLFRQDLLVASLFRNYLLAERVLQSVGCTPVRLIKGVP